MKAFGWTLIALGVGGFIVWSGVQLVNCGMAEKSLQEARP